MFSGDAQVKFGDITYDIIDMGGLRTERRKWKRKYENIDAVFFVASLTDWAQELYEDESRNRMQESLAVWLCHRSCTWLIPNLGATFTPVQHNIAL